MVCRARAVCCNRRMQRLAGRVALITGAAGGIGRATAGALADAGCALVLVDRNPEALQDAATALSERGRVLAQHALDVSDRGQMRALADTLAAEQGELHVLVNNAGINATAAFAAQPLDELERVMAVNFGGVLYGCKLLLPLLRRAGEGHIVNISSLAGLIAFPSQAIYCASKFAVRGLSEALRMELSGEHIGVTCVHPGAVRTGLLRTGYFTDPLLRQRFESLLQRFGVPPERLAERIVEAIRHDKPRVVIGVDARVMRWADRWQPKLHRAGLSWLFRRIVSR